jgi:hypothetical protein
MKPLVVGYSPLCESKKRRHFDQFVIMERDPFIKKNPLEILYTCTIEYFKLHLPNHT